MAPSNMFSYLRPHHKRTGSNPASPDPSNSPAYQQIPASSVHSSDHFPSSRIQDNVNLHASSPVSPYPPILPPIPRVASQYHTSSQPSAISASQLPYAEQAQDVVKSGRIMEDRGFRPILQSVPYESLLNQDDMRIPANTTASGAPSEYKTKAQRPVDQGIFDRQGDESSLRPVTSNLDSTASSNSYFNNSRSQSSLSTGSNDKQPVSIKPP